MPEYVKGRTLWGFENLVCCKIIKTIKGEPLMIFKNFREKPKIKILKSP